MARKQSDLRNSCPCADTIVASRLNAADIIIIIRPHGGTFECEVDITGLGQPFPPFVIRMSQDEISCRYESFCKLLKNLTRIETRPDEIRDIAFEGYELFNSIFPEDIRRELIKTIKKFPVNDEPANIQVRSSEFMIPWGLLYFEEPIYGKINPESFLGTRGVVTRQLGTHQNSSIKLDRNLGRAKPKILVGYCNRFEHVCDVEIPFFKRLDRAGRIKLDILPKFVGDQPRDDEIHTRDFCERISKNRHEIVHLACHCENGSTPKGRFLRIRDMQTVSQRAMSAYKASIGAQAIMFLNACSIGINNPKHYETFVSFLLEKGARAVLAPECEVGDEKGASFSCDFYSEFLSGKGNMRRAVLMARRKRLLNKDYSGLAYSLYGRGDFHYSAELRGGENDEKKKKSKKS